MRRESKNQAVAALEQAVKNLRTSSTIWGNRDRGGRRQDGGAVAANVDWEDVLEE